MRLPLICTFFFFNDTATTEIYTLSLHDALPICLPGAQLLLGIEGGKLPSFLHLKLPAHQLGLELRTQTQDRKSTRLNSSHLVISYAVFCLKKKMNPRSASTSVSHIPTHAVIASS